MIDIDQFFSIGSIKDEIILFVLFARQTVPLEKNKLIISAEVAWVFGHKSLCKGDDLIIDEVISGQLEYDDWTIFNE